MKYLILIATLLSAPSSFAKCGAFLTNEKYATRLISWNELHTALEKRGYYLRDSQYYDDIELELSFSFLDIQSCGPYDTSFGHELRALIDEFKEPLNSVEMHAKFVKENETVTYKKGLPLYVGNSSRIRKKIRQMIRELPVCR